MKRVHKAVPTASLLVLLFCLTVSLSHATSSPITNGIGLSIPLSGPLEHCGRSALEQANNWVAIRKSAQAANDTISLVVLDDASSPFQSSLNAKLLITAGVRVLIAPCGTESLKAVQRVVTEQTTAQDPILLFTLPINILASANQSGPRGADPITIAIAAVGAAIVAVALVFVAHRTTTQRKQTEDNGPDSTHNLLIVAQASFTRALAVVAHELINPLFASSLLVHEIEHETGTTRRTAILRSTIERMSGVLQDIRLMVDMPGTVRPSARGNEVVDLSTFFRDVCYSIRAMYDIEACVEMTCAAQHLTFDRVLVRQLVAAVLAKLCMHVLLNHDVSCVQRKLRMQVSVDPDVPPHATGNIGTVMIVTVTVEEGSDITVLTQESPVCYDTTDANPIARMSPRSHANSICEPTTPFPDAPASPGRIGAPGTPASYLNANTPFIPEPCITPGATVSLSVGCALAALSADRYSEFAAVLGAAVSFPSALHAEIRVTCSVDNVDVVAAAAVIAPSVATSQTMVATATTNDCAISMPIAQYTLPSSCMEDDARTASPPLPIRAPLYDPPSTARSPISPMTATRVPLLALQRQSSGLTLHPLTLVAPLNCVSPSCLIIEDEKVIREMVTRFVRACGFTATSLPDGADLLQSRDRMASIREYSIILLDIVMPRSNGVEVGRAVRAAGYQGQLFAMTANTSVSDRIAYTAAGFDGVLAKPFTKSDVQAVLVCARDEPSSDRKGGEEPGRPGFRAPPRGATTARGQ